jgi:hypothetical protein
MYIYNIHIGPHMQHQYLVVLVLKVLETHVAAASPRRLLHCTFDQTWELGIERLVKRLANGW